MQMLPGPCWAGEFANAIALPFQYDVCGLCFSNDANTVSQLVHGQRGRCNAHMRLGRCAHEAAHDHTSSPSTVSPVGGSIEAAVALTYPGQPAALRPCARRQQRNKASGRSE